MHSVLTLKNPRLFYLHATPTGQVESRTRLHDGQRPGRTIGMQNYGRTRLGPFRQSANAIAYQRDANRREIDSNRRNDNSKAKCRPASISSILGDLFTRVLHHCIAAALPDSFARQPFPPVFQKVYK
jgi:hypothetical protein